MIFVTVSGFEFERLIKKMDEIADELREKVIMQIGKTKYKPKNATYYKFIEPTKMEKIIQKSRIVISHAGAGSIINALKAGKPLIVVPRKKELKECFSEHQIQLARFLERKGMAEAVYDVEDMKDKIKTVSKAKKKYKTGGKKLVNFLDSYLRRLSDAK